MGNGMRRIFAGLKRPHGAMRVDSSLRSPMVDVNVAVAPLVYFPSLGLSPVHVPLQLRLLMEEMGSRSHFPAQDAGLGIVAQALAQIRNRDKVAVSHGASVFRGLVRAGWALLTPVRLAFGA